MQLNDEFERQSLKVRQQLMLVVVVITLLTAFLSVALHFWFSRDMALQSAEEKYHLTATATRNYLAHMDANAVETVQVVSRFPSLIRQDARRGPWINDGTKQLFAEVMRTNPVFYALYIGFDDGDLYELVNLNSSEVIRRQLSATPEDRWVVIAVEGAGDQRRRTFEYYSADFTLNFTRSEPSDYDVRERIWYNRAKNDEVGKTRPYLFQHLQAPGQSFVKKLPGTDHVLALDITFSTLSSHLRAQSLSASGELYLFQNDGSLLATNHGDAAYRDLPPVSPMKLTAQQRDYIQSLGTVHVSNEMDWVPVDFTVGGDPSGYSVDVIRVLSRMLSLKTEFVNGYSWAELVHMFERGELELLQPVVAVEKTRQELTQPMLDMPFALVRRTDQAAITDMTDLNGKTLAIIGGWSILPVLKQRFPDIRIKTMSSIRDALQAVRKGTAAAAIDAEIVLSQTLLQQYMTDLTLDNNVPQLKDLPHALHIRVRPDLAPLKAILDQAITAMPLSSREFLRKKWFAESEMTSPAKMSVVPYRHLQKLTRSGRDLEKVELVNLNGKDYFSFASVFTRAQNPPEYFALVIPAEQVYASSMKNLWLSVVIIAVTLLLFMPVILFFFVVRPFERMLKRRYSDEMPDYTI
ncbi:MAG: hypothetical protein CMI02_17545 [Oceanospirillaceae bacterium]|nr:hypothetical protein [Oceanospirillaceae bacterium]MBT13828.1 hypothetical protein [Oceanospirillaceae bacterium]|tara:strand:+ start:33441 stop:35345 length:1905 start_codon:yes stop_codon:yes gene_type:complete